MKKILFLLLLSCSFHAAMAQRFGAESDVLSYLNGKSFRNSDIGLTVNFSEMGTQLEVNGILCYSPDIRVISEYKALCIYYRISNPEQKVSGIINSKDKTWTDRTNGRVYKLLDY